MADDWTTGDFDENPWDDYALPSAGAADGKNAGKIKEENTFEPIPLGVHTLLIHRIDITSVEDGRPVEVLHDCSVDGEATSFDALDVKVELCLGDDPRKKVNVFFVLPPSAEDQQITYAKATSKTGKKAGWHYNQLRHFLSAAGFVLNDDGTIPRQALFLRAWRLWPDGSPRQIVGKVREQVDYKTNVVKTNASGQSFREVEPFSFAEADDTLRRQGRPVQERLGLAQPKATASSGSPPAAPAKPAQAPARSAAAPGTRPAPRPTAASPGQASAPAGGPPPSGRPPMRF